MTTSENTEPPDADSLSIEFSDDGAGPVDLGELRRLSGLVVRAAARGVCPGGAVRVRLVDDEQMTDAHERYCGVGGTTDVITFDLGEGRSAEGEPLDVDLIVCVDEARRQAGERAHSIETELALYTLHGVLHALGYDDLDEESYRRMHEREDEVFRAVGLGAAFGRGERS